MTNEVLWSIRPAINSLNGSKQVVFCPQQSTLIVLLWVLRHSHNICFGSRAWGWLVSREHCFCRPLCEVPYFRDNLPCEIGNCFNFTAFHNYFFHWCIDIFWEILWHLSQHSLIYKYFLRLNIPLRVEYSYSHSYKGSSGNYVFFSSVNLLLKIYINFSLAINAHWIFVVLWVTCLLAWNYLNLACIIHFKVFDEICLISAYQG